MVNSLARMGVIPLSVVSAAVVYISGSMTRSIPYENTLLKISSWACHYGAAADFDLFGRTAGRWSCVGICTPSRQFFTNAVPIGNLFGVVIAAKIADSYLPKESELTGWTGIAIYAGLVLWAIYDHWDHHRVVDAAEKIPIIGGATGHERYFDKYGMQTLVSTGNGDFDPINAQMSCIMDLPNILFRVPNQKLLAND
uniref:Uncharacterized protein n=1 Tax=Ditylenchus dipsaci TaxID=166011 RepID=A0A915EG62_9BILA